LKYEQAIIKKWSPVFVDHPPVWRDAYHSRRGLHKARDYEKESQDLPLEILEKILYTDKGSTRVYPPLGVLIK